MQIPSNLCLKCMQARSKVSPRLLRMIYEEHIIQINVKELAIQQLNRLSFDL